LIVVPGGKSPARKLLKFKPTYSEKDAYNALRDLCSIEILVDGFSRYPDQPMQLCTADRQMALFWAGTGASKFDHSDGATTIGLSPVSEMFPEPFWKEWRSDNN
jgi:hypothetical protein